MRLTICVFDTAAGPNLVCANRFDPSLLRSIRKSDMSHSHSASNTKLKVSEAITFPIHMDEEHNQINFGVVSELFVTILLQKNYIDTIIKSIQLVEQRIVPYRFLPLPILTIHEAVNEDEKKKYGPRQEDTENRSLLVTPTSMTPSKLPLPDS